MRRAILGGDRPQGGDRRRGRRLRRADRQPLRAGRARLRRHHRHQPLQHREGQAAAGRGRREDAAGAHDDAAAAALRAPGRRGDRGAAGQDRHQRQGAERRVGAVAQRHLRQQGLRPRRSFRTSSPSTSATTPSPTTTGATSRRSSTRCSTRSRTPANAAERNKLLGDAQKHAGRTTRPTASCSSPSSRPSRRRASRACGRTCRSSPTTCRRCLVVSSALHDLCAHGTGRAPTARAASRRSRSRRRCSTTSSAGSRICRPPGCCGPRPRSSRRAPPRRAGGAASRSARSTACRPRSRRTSRRAATRCPPARRPSSCKPAAADAPPAARLKEAGAVIVSKTTMPDYGMLSSGLSSFHALARNPWDLRKTPGGSSAGAGAAAAAGYGPLHIGTDIGGSLRLPAGWCGIFTLKPSLGRIPIDPPYMGRAAGPMTRSVADAALMMQVLAQPDARDSMSLPAQDIAWPSFDVARRAPARPAHRPAAGCRLRPGGRARDPRGRRAGGARCSSRPAPSSSRCSPSCRRPCSTAWTICGACARWST